MPSEPSVNVPHLHSFTLGDWLVDPRACQISRGGTVVKLRAQLMDLLVCLARRAGEIVLKDEILEEVWPGQYIAESGLSRCIAELRQFLQDDAQQPRYIETITKRGYRMVARVVWVARDEEKPAAETVRTEPGISIPAQSHEQQQPGAAAPAGPPRKKISIGWSVAGAAMVLLVAVVIVVVMALRPTRSHLTDRDSIIVCFENHTGEALFNGALQLALAVQLEQSPFLRVISDEHVRETMRLMGKPPETPLARGLVAEVCEREAARAMVVGSIARLGSRYAVGLEAIACRTGDTLAREQMQVESKEQVLDGLGEVAKRLRQRLGESLASVERYTVPVVRATTSSLDALRAASLGDMEWRRGRAEEAVARYREAIAFDPSFALAYARLGPPLSLLVHSQQYEEALTRAYELRERTTLPERLEIEARYYQGVLDDHAKTIEAFEALRRTYPRSSVAHRGLAMTYTQVGRYDEALVEAQEAVRLEPDSGPQYGALALAYLYLNRFDEAKKTVEAAIAKKIDDAVLHTVLLDCAFVAGDDAAMARELAWAASHTDAEMLFLAFEAERAIYAGKLREARSICDRSERIARARGDADQEATTRLALAGAEAIHGRRDTAVRRARDLLSKPASDRVRMRAAIVLALGGAVDQVEALVRESERKPNMQGDSWRHLRLILLAMVENERRHPARAIELLQPLAPVELGVDYLFLPVIVRGQAHLLARNGAAAITEYEKILAHPGLGPRSEMITVARVGIARAHVVTGNIQQGRKAYETLLAQLKDADPDLPMLLDARREYAALPR